MVTSSISRQFLPAIRSFPLASIRALRPTPRSFSTTPTAHAFRFRRKKTPPQLSDKHRFAYVSWWQRQYATSAGQFRLVLIVVFGWLFIAGPFFIGGDRVGRRGSEEQFEKRRKAREYHEAQQKKRDAKLLEWSGRE